jgi:hypothetical protein
MCAAPQQARGPEDRPAGQRVRNQRGGVDACSTPPPPTPHPTTHCVDNPPAIHFCPSTRPSILWGLHGPLTDDAGSGFANQAREHWIGAPLQKGGRQRDKKLDTLTHIHMHELTHTHTHEKRALYVHWPCTPHWHPIGLYLKVGLLPGAGVPTPCPAVPVVSPGVRRPAPCSAADRCAAWARIWASSCSRSTAEEGLQRGEGAAAGARPAGVAGGVGEERQRGMLEGVCDACRSSECTAAPQQAVHRR